MPSALCSKQVVSGDDVLKKLHRALEESGANRMVPLPRNTWIDILRKSMRDMPTPYGLLLILPEPQRGLMSSEMEMVSFDVFLKLCLVSILGEPFREKALSGKTEKLLLCYL